MKKFFFFFSVGGSNLDHIEHSSYKLLVLIAEPIAF